MRNRRSFLRGAIAAGTSVAANGLLRPVLAAGDSRRDWAQAVDRLKEEVKAAAISHRSMFERHIKSQHSWASAGTKIRWKLALSEARKGRPKGMPEYYEKVQAFARAESPRIKPLLEHVVKLEQVALGMRDGRVVPVANLGRQAPKGNFSPWRFFPMCLTALRRAWGSGNAAARQQATETLAAGLHVVADLDRWLLFHVSIIEEEARLALQHAEPMKAGCDFIGDPSGASIDFLEMHRFYRTLCEGDAGFGTGPGRATAESFPNLLPRCRAPLARLLDHLPQAERKRCTGLLRNALTRDYDCAYLNFSLHQWGSCQGEKQLASLVASYLRWAARCRYGQARLYDGLMDAIRPGYVGCNWYRGGALDRCDPRVLAMAARLEGDAHNRTVTAIGMFNGMRRRGTLRAGGGAATIKACLDEKVAGCGLTSAILGSTLAASGLDGVHAVCLRGVGGGHAIVAVQTPKGLVFADGQTGLVNLFPVYMAKRQREAQLGRYKTTIVLDRSFASDRRSLVILWARGSRKPFTVARRPPYYLCSFDGKEIKGRRQLSS